MQKLKCLKEPIYDEEQKRITKGCRVEVTETCLEGYPHVLVRKERFISRKTGKLVCTSLSYIDTRKDNKIS